LRLTRYDRHGSYYARHELTRKKAIDLQILQRVLTKIRGGEDQLSLILGVYDEGSNQVKESSLISLFDQYNEISDFDDSRLKVLNLAKELLVYGHTI